MNVYPEHNVMVLVDMLSDRYSRDHKERILLAIKALRDDDKADAIEALHLSGGCAALARVKGGAA